MDTSLRLRVVIPLKASGSGLISYLVRILVEGTYSDPDGYYVIDLLPAGEYVVYTENESVFVDVYWDNS